MINESLPVWLSNHCRGVGAADASALASIISREKQRKGALKTAFL